ncbi:MAG: hypothetical protein IJP59_10155 [Muribaculaceae bacterium]|nr:hypothetical protein [Muribaculaceae bacterium]
MRKFLTFAVMAFIAVAAWADEVTFDFSSEAGLQAMGITAPAQSNGVNLTDVGTITMDGVSLTAVNGSTETRVWNSQGSYTLRIYVGGSITFAVESGSITDVAINAANTSNFDLLANVGNYSVNGAVGTWNGSTSSVTFSHTTTKNAQIATIVVTTSDEAPTDDPNGEDPDPVDPNITKLDSLANINTLDDGTEFQFTTEAYVQYQWGNYLWLMQLDADYYAYAAMVYGDVARTYQVGAVIPAGWTGVKTTYKGLVEITDPTHFKNATGLVDDMFTEPFDMTGYMSYIESDHYENMRVKFNGIALSDIDNSGNFTITSNEKDEDGNDITVTMAGYNKFGIDYPVVDPAERYNIDGMVTIYNNNYQLYPISIEEAPGTRLWKVTYEGLEGNMKIADTLYVALPMTDGQILVTDNVLEVLVDTYAEWGYTWYQDWYPTWIALDCGDNTELYNAICQMQALAPNTVKGEVVDVNTNPRLILSSTPTGIADPDFESLHLYSYDLNDGKIYALGNEMGQATGRYKLINGDPYLCSAQDTVQVRLDFSLNPELEITLNEGSRYDMTCVFKLSEPWEAEDASYAPRRSYKSAVNRVMKAPSLKAKISDADYYTNYTIMPISASSITGINDIDVAKQAVKVSYVNMTGTVSDNPFPGMNIVVTEFNDGTRTVAKQVK